MPSLGEEPSIGDGDEREYGGELVIVDQKGHRHMTDGSYTMVLSDLQKQQAAAIVPSAGRGTWQTFNGKQVRFQHLEIERR